MAKRFKRVLVTGGAGYVGSSLVPKLLAADYEVNVLDLYIYGDVFADLASNPKLTEVKGDLRNPSDVPRALSGCDAVIHLACISNDPSFDLNPDLGRSINYDCFRPLVKASKDAGVKRFIYASSSSVYGIKNDVNVTEDLPLEPLTDYSKYKAMCEEVLEQEREPGFVAVTLRPATVCGYAPRLRLDLTVNILTSHAINNGRITVFGGEQLRPNLHVEDMTDLYLQLLEAPDETINGKTWNAGYHNLKVREIADMVRNEVGKNVDIVVTPSDDHRSYHVSSEKIKKDLGFSGSAHGFGCHRRSHAGIQCRQGAECDDGRSLLQYQAHAGSEAAMTGAQGPTPVAAPGAAGPASMAIKIAARQRQSSFWCRCGVRPFISQFLRVSLPTLLAPGNLPALAKSLPCKLIFLTSSDDAADLRDHPAIHYLRGVCDVEISIIDDLITGDNYSTTITLAYARAVRAAGDAMLDTCFFFMISDYIMADGSLANVLAKITAGYSGVVAGNFQVVEESARESFFKTFDAGRSTNGHSDARKLMHWAMNYLHPMTLANMVNFPLCHSVHSNRLFWRVDDNTLIGRFYLMHMICIQAGTHRLCGRFLL